MAHSLYIYDTDDLMKDSYGPAYVMDFNSAGALTAAADERRLATGTVFSFGIKADPDLCGDLADFIAIENIQAAMLAEHPEDNAYISDLTDDLEHWEMLEITTAHDLAAFLGHMAAREALEFAW